MPAHARGPRAPPPRKVREIKTVAGGVSDVTSRANRGPMTRNALNRQRSETQKPRKPETPSVSQFHNPACDEQRYAAAGVKDNHVQYDGQHQSQKRHRQRADLPPDGGPRQGRDGPQHGRGQGRQFAELVGVHSPRMPGNGFSFGESLTYGLKHAAGFLQGNSNHRPLRDAIVRQRTVCSSSKVPRDDRLDRSFHDFHFNSVLAALHPSLSRFATFVH